jgi:hypothetical protein
MKPYLIVLLIAVLNAIAIVILDLPKYIFIVLVISTVMSLIAVGIKENLKKEPKK